MNEGDLYLCRDGGWRCSAVDGANHADLASLLMLLHSVNDEERWSVAIQLYNEWVERMVGILEQECNRGRQEWTDDMIMV